MVPSGFFHTPAPAADTPAHHRHTQLFPSAASSTTTIPVPGICVCVCVGGCWMDAICMVLSYLSNSTRAYRKCWRNGLCNTELSTTVMWLYFTLGLLYSKYLLNRMGRIYSQSTHNDENNYQHNSGGLHSSGRSHYSHWVIPVWMCAGWGKWGLWGW